MGESDLEVMRRIRRVIADARAWHLPLDRAELHVGAAAQLAILRNCRVEHVGAGAPLKVAGIPFIYEERADPDLIELRWTVRG